MSAPSLRRRRVDSIAAEASFRARVAENGAYALRKDVRGPIEQGDIVQVITRSDRKVGAALVTGIEGEWVYLSLAWGTLTSAYGWRPR